MNHKKTTRQPPASISTEQLVNYAKNFQDHQNYVQAHLNGQLEGAPPLLPTFLPPASYWTPSEKDRFFHGLSLYSRLRPDLIAEHIKSKSTFDVCVYLDALHVAASRETSNHQADIRNQMDPAMEVSKEWITREESLAMSLSEASTCLWSVPNPESDGLHAKHDCTCPYDQHHITQLDGYSSTEPLEKRPVDEYLNHLDSACLLALGNIIREAEQEDVDSDGDIYAHEVARLAQQDGVETNAPRALPDQMPETTNSDLLDTPMDNHDGSIVDAKHQFDTDNSNSKMRRRIKNRIYMRRKRAEKAGQPILPGVIKLRPGRKTRERKPSKPRPTTYKSRKGTSGKNRLSNVDSAAESLPTSEVDWSDDESLEYEAHTKGGLTKPYRIKKLFLDHGIDAEILSNMELDFFHMSSVRRLLSFLNSLEKEATISISTNTIQLLVGLVKEFVSSIVRHVIITKEQEIRLKRSLNIWTYDPHEISGENMVECLKTMDLKFLKEKIFQRMAEGHGLDATSLFGDPKPTDVLTEKEKMALQSRSTQFTLPQSLLWCCFPNYQSFPGTDDMMSETTDEAALEKELNEEDELDDDDSAKSKEFEETLWNMV